MASPDSSTLNEETTFILLSLTDGDRDAADRLLPLIYDEMRRIAGWYMSGERGDHTLNPTALVHEAFLRLHKMDRIEWNGRAHFCGVAAHVMRRVLVDHARRRNAQKRSAPLTSMPIPDEIATVVNDLEIDVLDLNDALEELNELNPRHVQVVEMRFFAGMSIDETAAILNVSPSTVKGDWRMARAWLLSRMDGAD